MAAGSLLQVYLKACKAVRAHANTRQGGASWGGAQRTIGGPTGAHADAMKDYLARSRVSDQGWHSSGVTMGAWGGYRRHRMYDRIQEASDVRQGTGGIGCTTGYHRVTQGATGHHRAEAAL